MSRFIPSSNALDILKKDHRELVAKFKLYEKIDDNDVKQKLAADICNSLTIHCTCEEEVLYPLAQSVVEKSPIYVGEIEHSYIMELVDTVTESNPDDQERDALMKVLAEYTHAHIKQEESTLFPLLKSTAVDLKRIGITILDLKLKMVERFRKISEFEAMDLPSAKLN